MLTEMSTTPLIGGHAFYRPYYLLFTVVELAGYTSEQTFSCYIYFEHFAT